MTNETIHYLYLQEPYRHVDPAKYLKLRSKQQPSKIEAALFKVRKLTQQTSKGKEIIEMEVKEPEIIFDNAIREIFIWCVLTCKTEVALIFWERFSDPMLMALLAQMITHELERTGRHSDMCEHYQKQIETFEKLAYEVLNECYEGDQRKVTILLLNPYENFDNVTLLDLAVQANSEMFVKNVVVQKLLTNIWFGNIDTSTSYITIEVEITERNVNSQGIELNTYDPTKRARHSIHNIRTKPKKKTMLYHYVERYFFGYFRKFLTFFNTPVIKFCYHCISHICLLLLFSFVMLTQFYPKIQWFEVVLTIWVGSLIVEEIRQLISGNTSSFRLLLMTYLTDMWNLMDLINISLYIIGFVLRLIPIGTCTLCFYSGRILMSFSLMFYCLRALRFFSLHPEMGPFLLMVKKTFNHALYFMAIVIVSVIAYGIALTVIQFPNHAFDYNSFFDIFLQPWYSIKLAVAFPECSVSRDSLTLSQALKPAETCAVEGLNPDQCYGRKEDCRANEWLEPVMASFYILFTNVLMLNLLIAMISDTYAEMSSKNELVWSMQRYNLIREYLERPCLPHPFILFEHIYLILRSFYPKKPIPLERKTKFDFAFSVTDLPNSVKRDLIKWERIQAERYIKVWKIVESNNALYKFNQTSRNFDSMNMRLDKISNEGILSADQPSYSKYDLSFNHEFPPRLHQRFDHFEEEIVLLLAKFAKKDKSKKKAKKVSSSPLQSLKMNSKKNVKNQYLESEKEKCRNEFQTELGLHINCRERLCYQNTTDGSIVFRAVVLDSQVPFEVDHATYQPTTFTDPSVYASPEADEDLITNPSASIEFNSNTGDTGIRVSLVRTYDVVDGLPLNPMGRTGLKGRGLLKRWGPNRIHKAVFIRWENRDKTGSLKRLQFLATSKNKNNECFSIPSVSSTTPGTRTTHGSRWYASPTLK